MLKIPAIPSSTKIIAGIVLLLGAFTYGGYLGTQWEKGQQAREDAKLQHVEERAQRAAAREIAKIRVVNKTIYQETQREVFNNPVYRDCVLPDDGLRLLNRAIEGTGGSGLPETGAPSEP